MSVKKEIGELTEAIINISEDNPRLVADFKSKEVQKLAEVTGRLILNLESKYKAEVRKTDEYRRFLDENRIMQSDRITAYRIQQSMLPTDYPAFDEFPNVDLFADMDAANETGGDFYDYFKTNDDKICFSISDIEGKGIPAAMYMAVSKTLIKLRLESGESLAQVFESVNEQLCKSSMQKRFITMWTGIYDIKSEKLTFVNAGHNYPIIKRDGKPSELIKERSGIPLAAFYSKKRRKFGYTEFETEFKKGDMLLLYTDGVTETQNKNGDMFGEERLLKTVDLYMNRKSVKEPTESRGSMKDLIAYLRRQVINFSGKTVQDDDITMLGIKIN